MQPLLMTEATDLSRSQEASTALADVVTAFFRNARQIGIAVVIALLALTGVFVFRAKSYESHMRFLVRDEAATLPVASIDERGQSQSAPLTTEAQIGTEIEFLLSNDLHRQVIAALHPGLPDGEIDRRLLAFNKSLSVLPVPKATLISVTYTAPSRDEANATLAILSRLYLANRARIRGTDGAYTFFDQEATRYHVMLRQDQAALAAFNRKYQVTSMSEEKDILVHKLSDARASVYENEASSGEGDKQIQAMVIARASLPSRITTQRRDLPDQMVAERLNASLVDLQNKRVELLTKYHPTDRHVQELDEQIANTRDALQRARMSKSTEEQTDLNPIRQNVEADLGKLQVRSAGLRARERSLDSEVRGYEAKLQQLNQITAEYDDLTRKVQEDASGYDLYFKRREDARINRNLDNEKIANVRLIEGPEVVPESKGQRFVSMACIYIIGTLLVTAGGVLLGLWSPRFQTPWELETAIGAPVLATIPKLADTSDKKAFFRQPVIPKSSPVEPEGPYEKGELVKPERVQLMFPLSRAIGGIDAEFSQSGGAYLSLVERLRKIDPRDAGGGTVFAFTACTRGEGVSHFVRGLGTELTNYTGKRVAIVNAPDIFEKSMVAATASDTDALIWGRSANSGEKFVQQWFKGLRETHDYVLIDCPSLSTSRAATIFGPQSDGLLLVVGAGRATRTQVRGSLAMLALASVRVVGLALNNRTYPIPDAVYSLL